MVYHQINIESYILSKVHTSELYIGAEKARKNRNVFPCLLQRAFFVILYNQLNYLKILFYAFCQFYIINELFSNFLLIFTYFLQFRQFRQFNFYSPSFYRHIYKKIISADMTIQKNKTRNILPDLISHTDKKLYPY